MVIAGVTGTSLINTSRNPRHDCTWPANYFLRKLFPPSFGPRIYQNMYTVHVYSPSPWGIPKIHILYNSDPCNFWKISILASLRTINHFKVIRIVGLCLTHHDFEALIPSHMCDTWLPIISIYKNEKLSFSQKPVQELARRTCLQSFKAVSWINSHKVYLKLFWDIEI